MSSPDYPHGILGHWAVVGHGFNIASISASAVVIGTFIWACTKDKRVYVRPSFRMTAWIAVCDTIYSTCQLCVFNNDFMSSRSEMNLRVIHWLMSGSILSFAFLAACVGIQLVLTVLSKNTAIARRIQPWYEATGLLLGFLITHPFLYLYEKVQWAPKSQAFHIISDHTYYRATSWLTMWAWLTMCCTFLLVVGILVFYKMFFAFADYAKLAVFPEGNDLSDSPTQAREVRVSPERAHQIRSVVLRILIYSAVPIFTQIWVIVGNMLNECPMWIYVLGNLIPATQGMINFLVYLSNPAWDRHRHRLLDKVRRLHHRRNSNMADETDDETICQSIKIEK